jgi:hypothetical protein
MQLPGLLVEYFVGGAIAAAWVLPLLYRMNIRIEDWGLTTLVLAIPPLYALGMILDYIGLRFMERGTARIRDKATRQLPEEVKAFTLSDIVVASPELATQLEMRSSRDRIARSLLASLLIGTLSYCVTAVLRLEYGTFGISFVAGSALTWITYLAWRRFEESTTKFMYDSARAILQSGTY